MHILISDQIEKKTHILVDWQVRQTPDKNIDHTDRQVNETYRQTDICDIQTYSPLNHTDLINKSHWQTY